MTNELEYNHLAGRAKQKSLYRIKYDKEYFQRYQDRANTGIERALNRKRYNLISKYRKGGERIIDVGVGNLSFLKIVGCRVRGSDINQITISALGNRYSERINGFDHVTMWDVIEHLENPGEFINQIKRYCYISTPIYTTLCWIEKSKHFKIGEHLWYFTDTGIRNLFDSCGFDCLECNDIEMRCGRESIYTYVFKKRGM